MIRSATTSRGPSTSVLFPRALQPLFRPARYKTAVGGRASAKSWSFARALVMLASRDAKLILCGREHQNSLSDSVHRLLCNQIDALGLSRYFSITDKSITSSAGSEFIFRGLRSNIDSIKSMEGVDIAWIEEAQRVSEDSYQKLIPTIRKPGSEIWISYNPENEHDPTHQRFFVNRPPNSVLMQVSWRDNPALSDELKAERDYLRRVDHDAYLWVWEGHTRQDSDAQILRGKWRIEPFEIDPTWDGPYQGLDFGFAVDPTAFVRCYIHGRTLYVSHEYYQVGLDTDYMPAKLRTVPGAEKYTTRADSARPETISYLQRHDFPRVVPVDKWTGSVEDGIAFLRSFEAIVVHPRCKHVAEEARLYSYKVDKLTNDVLAEVVDKHNHTIDAIRYALAPMIRNATTGMLAFMAQQHAQAQTGG